MPQKVWIKGFESLYKVSEDGKVYTYKVGKGTIKEGSELKQSTNAKGYSQLRLYDLQGKGFSFKVHKLVAEAFVDNLDNLSQVDHIDNVKSNNSSSNLRWVSAQTNVQKALSKVYYLTHKDGSGVFVHNLNRWCNTLGFNIQTFYKMKNKQRKSAYGYIGMEVYHS